MLMSSNVKKLVKVPISEIACSKLVVIILENQKLLFGVVYERKSSEFLFNNNILLLSTKSNLLKKS